MAVLRRLLLRLWTFFRPQRAEGGLARELASHLSLLKDEFHRGGMTPESTPLGMACRWGRVELVTLLLERGADPIEVDAESWATPQSWAEKMNHGAAISVLRKRGRS